MPTLLLQNLSFWRSKATRIKSLDHQRWSQWRVILWWISVFLIFFNHRPDLLEGYEQVKVSVFIGLLSWATLLIKTRVDTSCWNYMNKAAKSVIKVTERHWYSLRDMERNKIDIHMKSMRVGGSDSIPLWSSPLPLPSLEMRSSSTLLFHYSSDDSQCLGILAFYSWNSFTLQQ